MVNRSSSTFKHDKACFCNRPSPCDCGTKRSILKSKIPPEDLVAEANKHIKCMSTRMDEGNAVEDAYTKQLEETVLDWLQEIPVYAHFNAKDRQKREEIITLLINTLRQLQKDDMYLEKAEGEINKCLQILPMWHPESRQRKESFDNQLAYNLLQRLKNLITDKNPFKMEISKWVDSIPFDLDKGKLLDELIDKLKPIAVNRPLHNTKYRDALKYEIVTTLKGLPFEINGSRTATINEIADKLVDKLIVIPFDQAESEVEKNKNLQKDHQPDELLPAQFTDKLLYTDKTIQTSENLKDIIEKWCHYIPDISNMDIIENKKVIETLATKLQELQTIQNNENRHNYMRREILHWLQALQKQQGKYLDSGTQENLVNKLMNMMKDGSKESKNVMSNETELITQNIWEWFKLQPEFKQDKNSNYRDMVIELSDKLQHLKDVKGDLKEYDVESELTNWFEQLFHERGIVIDPKNRKKLQDILLSTINPLKKRKYWKKPNKIHEVITKTVTDVMNDLVLPIQVNDKEQLKDQIVKVITHDYDSAEIDKTLSKIVGLLKQETTLPESQIQTLANNLIKKVKAARLSDLDYTIPDDTLDKLKIRVENILQTHSVRDKGQIIDTITNILAKNYEDVNNDDNGDFKTIYEVLKNANVSENQAVDLTKKLLDMSNRFKNEVNETTYKTLSYGSTESIWTQKQKFMQRLEREITDFMETVLNESSSFYREKASVDLITGSAPAEGSTNLYNKFKNPPFKTSTPTGSSSQQDVDNREENEYREQIKDKIRKWISSLEVDGIMDNEFKQDMINDIAADMIDRHRYIQLSKTESSNMDEIEHLKYQVFKWTSKLPNYNTYLTTRTSKIKMLMKSLEAVTVPNLFKEPNKQQETSNDEVDSESSSENYAGVQTRDTNKFNEENIYDAIWSLLNEIPILKPTNSQERRFIDGQITELCNTLRDILSIDHNEQVINIENLCKDKIENFLVNIDHEQKASEDFIKKTASEFISYLKNFEFFANILKRNQAEMREAASNATKKDAIKKAVQNWCRKLPLKRGKTLYDIKEIVDELAEAISRYLLITDMENINTFMDDILSTLKKLPLQFDKDDTKNLPENTEALIATLKSVLNDSDKYYSKIITDDSTNRKPAYKKAAEIMYDNIQNWCENLPFDVGTTNENKEQANMIKHNLARKLLKKVGELNLDPEVFHDDDLYEDFLRDEIDQILDVLPNTSDLQEMLPVLKENLVKDLLDAKQGMKNEIAGFAYKQQLRDAISKTLSSIGLPVTEETPLEVLKDNLADAFISLHYVADDEELKRKFKDKIFDQVNKFCDDYLNRNPSSQLDANQLNQELYSALKKVPVPKDESMRREVEQIRIKDVVTDWFKDLPLENTQSHPQTNKIISVLAKRLYEIEKEAEFNPDIDIDETINTELHKWLKKLKLKTTGEVNPHLMAKNLINKLKATKDARKLDETVVRKSMDYADLTNGLNMRPKLPPSSLSAEDRAHLQRIRERTSFERTIQRPDDRKDASKSPVPIATGIQTEEKTTPVNNTFHISQNASIQTIIRDPEPPTPITPQVIVKEYYWNSHESPPMQHSGSILSCTRTPVTQPGESIQQQANISQETSHVTTASQTLPVTISKATITQEASIGQVIKTGLQNDDNKESTKLSCLIRQQQISNERNADSQVAHYNPDDYLQLNAKRNMGKKYCVPCIDRAVPDEFDGCPGVGTSKTFQDSSQQETDEQTEIQNHIHENKGYLENHDYINHLPCSRRPIYQTPLRDVEQSKPKRNSQQQCSCKNPTLIKCTIRPQAPCQRQQSHKSCFVSKKQCPKCWDGFCPHPSYLYFRRD